MNAFDYYVDPEQKEIERENRPHHWEETVQNLHPGVTEEFALAVRVHRLQEDRAVANLKLVQGGEEEE